MAIKTRFAPSPTGLLHVGNARTALVTWLFARSVQGSFLLRLDDTDQERSTEAFAEALQRDLEWLGLDHDAFARQRDRKAIYDAAIEKLKADGRLYPCYETPEELGLKRKTLLSRGLPPIYDRAALSLTDAQKRRYEAEGRSPHWRFLLKHDPIEWNDLIRGPVRFEGKDMSDPVLIREDGTPLYHICSVVDDADFGVTHIVRGEDHVSNTAAHVQMFEALGATPPIFAHLPLISDAEGGKLSKRLGSLSLQSLRDEEGIEPMAVASLLARLGTSLPIEPFREMNGLVESFSFERFSRSTPKLDPEDLLRLNAKILHDTPYEEVKDRLPESMDADFWMAIRPNISRIQDAQDWWQVARGPVSPIIEDPDYLKQAASLLPADPWDSATWQVWTDNLKGQTGRKGKALFMPLRKALTGMEHGPELGTLLPLIGPERTRERLSA